MRERTIILSALAAVAVVFAMAGTVRADMHEPFGGADDVAYAKKLWSTLETARLAGKGAIHSTPYEGSEPHGAILETLDTTITIGGHEGIVYVKRNYGGEGVSTAKVADAPDKWLAAVTVMFQREKGYDSDNQDWFWAKYGADGSLLENPAGALLAGRVAKGADAGCIACHTPAPGGDYIFNNDRHAR